MLLYVHHRYLSFPFEGTQYNLNYEGLYRVPSIQYIKESQRRSKTFRVDSCKYLINTRNDLPETQNKFEKLKVNFRTWTGIVGRKPPLQEIAHLFDRDIYLFMGHGTGLEHISSS